MIGIETNNFTICKPNQQRFEIILQSSQNQILVYYLIHAVQFLFLSNKVILKHKSG